MPGFCVQIEESGEEPLGVPLRLVDLGASDETDSFSWGPVRVSWSHRGDSKQRVVRRCPDRFLWIDGQVDRLPSEDEPLDHWLQGRWGSFRGFEVRTAPTTQVTVFADPLGTRPVYYLRTARGYLIADKLSTLALNCSEKVVPNIGALLEAVTIGALYSTDTTLEAACQLGAGEAMEFSTQGAALHARCEMPADIDITEERVRDNPAGALLEALRKAVAETWVDRDAWLLLSGGLDSRLTLALAGPGRKALTVTTRENRESRLAREIAAACQAEFRLWTRPWEHYHKLVRESFLLTGCLWDPANPHHLGLGAEWRREGIRGVANAFLYDTLLKDYFLFRRQRFVSPATSLYSVLGVRAAAFTGQRSGRGYSGTSAEVFRLLSGEAREAVLGRLWVLASSMEPEIEDGFDLALCRRIRRFLSRQCHYPLVLAWMEEQDVSTPVFHPALWSWTRFSSPRDLYKGKAFREALLALDHPVRRLVDANTGRPPELPSRDWRQALREQSFYPLLWRLLSPFRGSPAARPEASYPDEASWPPLAPVFRTRQGAEVVEEGLGLLSGTGLFDESGVWRLHHRYQKGEDPLLETVLALSALGRWLDFLRDPLRYASLSVYQRGSRRLRP